MGRPVSADGVPMELWLVGLIVMAVVVIAFLAVTIIYGTRAHRFKIGAGREDLVGRIARVKVALEPEGTVLVEGEWWSAVSESGRAEPGEEVIVTRVDGLTLYVRKK